MKNINLLCLLTILSMNLAGQQWPEEAIIGNTYYDLQTWRTMQNRIFFFDDGTIGALWNMGFNFPGFNDKGIGYNYYNGEQWGIFPWQSITSGWAEFPSYTDFGENGEICVSQGQNGLFINWRLNKGSGNWQQLLMTGYDLKHPVVVTSGIDNSMVHLLYLKSEPGFVPTDPQPDRGFIWYARSSDGMQTWEVNQQFSEIGPDHYLAFTIGAYCWSEPKGNTLAFVAGDYLTDLVLMKSPDGGDTWQKTIIWQHPYPNLEFFSVNTDTFYCNNGSMSITLDSFQNAHLTFGINYVMSHLEPSPLWYFPEVGGLVYWNEGMSPFSNNVNTLNPYGHPDSELIQDYNFIAWMQDINGNGQIDTLGDFSTYPTPGLIIMPQIIISDLNDLYVIFNSVTETYNNGELDYRHLWVRNSFDNGATWEGFYDLNSDIIHIFDECIYPSAVSSIIDNKLRFVYAADNYPGITWGGQPEFTENFIYYSETYIEAPAPFLTVNFMASPTIINEGETVAFQNLSIGQPDPVSFIWTFEGGDPASSSFENPDVSYQTEGIYDVTLNVSNGLMNQTLIKEDYITVLPATGIKGMRKEVDILSPNPSSGRITIKTSHEEPVSVKVYDLLGKKYDDQMLKEGHSSYELNFSGYPDGIYFLEIKSGSERTIQKVILRK